MKSRYPATSVLVTILRVLAFLSFAISILIVLFGFAGVTISSNVAGALAGIGTGVASLIWAGLVAFYGLVSLAMSEFLRMMMDVTANSFYLEEIANSRIHQSHPARGAMPVQPIVNTPPAPDPPPIPVYDPDAQHSRHSQHSANQVQDEAFMKLIDDELGKTPVSSQRRIICEKCGAKVKVPTSMIGKRAKCPRCSAAITTL